MKNATVAKKEWPQHREQAVEGRTREHLEME